MPEGPAGAPAAGAKSNRPKGSDFLQQRLKAWQPILTPRWIVAAFFIIGIVFIPVGVVLKRASDSVVETKVQYDGVGADRQLKCEAPDDVANNVTNTCNLPIEVSEDMEPPIYVYYELENFYQNHRRYVKSRDDGQLASGNPSENPSAGSFGDCDPLVKSQDGRILWPCGLIANSFFNDTFEITNSTSGDSVDIDEDNIAWESDKKEKFNKVENKEKFKGSYQFLDETYPLVIGSKGVENEHFIVWMRVASLPHFRKLYGRIRTPLKKGDVLHVQVNSSFPVRSFDGKKSFVISETSFLGGKNPFLGIAYIVVGCISLGLGLVFLIKQLVSPRKPAETTFLQWTPSQ
eukprot:gb/GECG01016696.1/.p1 GENE.gb/GECG01016696.1/~~gb/GECG01016696.1/.p1  ORF type:complete len:347 (+),score=35.19 gb/GECG01016696.1/:1-1041(+)